MNPLFFNGNTWTTLCVLVWSGWLVLTLVCNVLPGSRAALALRRRDRFGFIPGFHFFRETRILLRLQISTDHEGGVWSTYPLQQGHHWGTLLWGGAARRGAVVSAYLSALVSLVENDAHGTQQQHLIQRTPYAGLCALCREWAKQRGSTQVRFRIERAQCRKTTDAEGPTFSVVFTSPTLPVRDSTP